MKRNEVQARLPLVQTVAAGSTTACTVSVRKHVPSRQRVLEAACQMFAERGFHGTHVRDLCKSAGISIASVGYYFGERKDCMTP